MRPGHAALLLPLLLLACSEPDRSAPKRFDGYGFSLTLRKDILTSAEEPTPGVHLYDFHVLSMPFLFLYVGDKPGYPHFAAQPQEETDEALASGLSAHCRRSRGARECLITLSDHSPKQLHIWYEHLDAQWVKAADTVIMSLRPRTIESAATRDAAAIMR